MTPSEILSAAGEARPDLIEKVAKALYVLERTSPEYAAELASDIEEITAYSTEKVAAAGGSSLSPAGVAIGLGTALGVGLAGAVAVDLYDAAKRGLTKGRNYNRMMSNNPDLKAFDQKDLKRSFDTIHRYAPEMTADPSLAANLVKGLAVSPENVVGNVNELLKARKALADSKGATFRMGSLQPVHFGDEEPKKGKDRG